MFGIVVPLVAIAGILFAQRRPRLVGCALVVGCIAYGLVFTFHYMTHDYYHLPFVVVAARVAPGDVERPRARVRSLRPSCEY